LIASRYTCPLFEIAPVVLSIIGQTVPNPSPSEYPYATTFGSHWRYLTTSLMKVAISVSSVQGVKPVLSSTQANSETHCQRSVSDRYDLSMGSFDVGG